MRTTPSCTTNAKTLWDEPASRSSGPRSTEEGQPRKEAPNMNHTIRVLGVGAANGYGASMAMDQATGWYFGRQSEASRRREEEVAPGGAPVLVGKKLARLVGRDVSDEGAAKIGSVVHRSLGMTYGMAAAALAGKGVAPLAAGGATGGDPNVKAS